MDFPGKTNNEKITLNKERNLESSQILKFRKEDITGKEFLKSIASEEDDFKSRYDRLLIYFQSAPCGLLRMTLQF